MLGAGRDSCQSLLLLLHQPLLIFNLLRIQTCDRSYRFYVAALSAWPGSVSTIPGLGIVCSALWVLAAGLSWVRCRCRSIAAVGVCRCWAEVLRLALSVIAIVELSLQLVACGTRWLEPDTSMAALPFRLTTNNPKVGLL
jgi:hypothetical protein